jgi:hypothetical protein
MNRELLHRLEQELRACIEGQELTEEALDHFHDLVVEKLVGLFPAIEGLRDFLDGLKYIRYMSDGERTSPA